MAYKRLKQTPGAGAMVSREDDWETACIADHRLGEPSTVGGVESVGTVFSHTFLLSNG